MGNMDTFRFWCQKVLPLTYDDSLSYYEVLCRTFNYINDLIEQEKIIGKEFDALRNELLVVKKWIDDFDTSFIKSEIEKYVATMIFLEINDEGYIVCNIPESWKDITFNTTELDIVVNMQREYGHLVLSY